MLSKTSRVGKMNIYLNQNAKVMVIVMVQTILCN